MITCLIEFMTVQDVREPRAVRILRRGRFHILLAIVTKTKMIIVHRLDQDLEPRCLEGLATLSPTTSAGERYPFADAGHVLCATHTHTQPRQSTSASARDLCAHQAVPREMLGQVGLEASSGANRTRLGNTNRVP